MKTRAKAIWARRANGVLKAGQGGLTCQVIILNRTITDQLEDRIAPQHVMIILIWIVRDDAVDTHPCHVKKRVIDVPDVPPIDQGLHELLRESDLVIELPEAARPGTAFGVAAKLDSMKI